MRLKTALIAVALTAALFTARAGGVDAAANPDRACLVGVIVSNSAGPGFGPETANLAQTGVLDPAGVAAANCR
jgi:hypothetical protein